MALPRNTGLHHVKNKLQLGYFTRLDYTMLKTSCSWVILRGYGGPLGSTVNPPQTEPGRSMPGQMGQFARITCLDMWDLLPCNFLTYSLRKWLLLYSLYLCIAQTIIIVLLKILLIRYILFFLQIKK
jgi:hypothetical protein